MISRKPAPRAGALFLAAISLFALPLGAQVPAGPRVDSSQQLFAVLCALHASGYQSNLSDAAMHPLRARLRAEMLRKQGPAAEAMREFYRNHELADPGATLARYVSFALSVHGAPDFRWAFSRDEIPPDALALDGLNETLAAFYREANLGKLWTDVQAEYERELRKVQLPVADIVVTATGYLREVIRLQSGRSFTILVEPLIGAKTAFRNIGDDYWIVLSPSSSLPLDEIRHAYLHFLLDPLPIRYKAATNSKRIFLNYAARAPLLPPEYREDFESLLTECLVKAVELRLKRPNPEQLEAELSEAEQGGFVLVRPLYRELLASFDKSEPAMSYFFPDLLRGVRIGEEGERLEKLKFASGSGPRRAHAGKSTEESEAPPLSELELWLAEGDREIASQDAAGAGATFEKALAKYPGEPRALFGLAVASVLLRNAEKAKTLFQEVLAAAKNAEPSKPVPPHARAWSHVYLGRIYDLEGSRDLAISEYRAALSVTGAPDRALAAARQGVEKSFGPRQEPQ